jgi:hypothetical protein
MSDEVYRAIAKASSGFVESPAGCGKTEAIVKTVGAYCDDPQLVLTHTHAGVDALRQRFRDHRVPANKYHVDTIAGWAWGWVRKYPHNAGYSAAADIIDWNTVYATMIDLLQKRFVKQGILNSYAGIIVDEYQDCTVSMHRLIVELKNLLPCRVLGDELQGVFGFRKDPLVAWSEVQRTFKNNLGGLETPHRWIKAGNIPLGQWLLEARRVFREDREPNYAGSPVERRAIPYREVGKELIRVTTEKKGRICVVGPKAIPLPSGIETTLVKRGYRVLEPNDLTALRTLILALSDGSGGQQADAALKFLNLAYGGIATGDKTFIRLILKAQRQQPHRADRRTLCNAHTEGITPRLLIDVLRYIEELLEVWCKLRESVSALKCILEERIESGRDLKSLYAAEITKRKYQSRRNVYRCVGSTLLIKGLEFDHAMILRNPNWHKNWGNHKDLYVALTRGSKSVTLMDLRA